MLKNKLGQSSTKIHASVLPFRKAKRGRKPILSRKQDIGALLQIVDLSNAGLKYDLNSDTTEI